MEHLIKKYEKLGYLVIDIKKSNRREMTGLFLIKDGRVSFVDVLDAENLPTPMRRMQIHKLRQYGCQMITEDA